MGRLGPVLKVVVRICTAIAIASAAGRRRRRAKVRRLLRRGRGTRVSRRVSGFLLVLLWMIWHWWMGVCSWIWAVDWIAVVGLVQGVVRVLLAETALGELASQTCGSRGRAWAGRRKGLLDWGQDGMRTLGSEIERS